MDYILIAHGAWFQSDGQDKPDNLALYKIPERLSIHIYNVQGTEMLVTDGLQLLNLIRNRMLPQLQPGQNTIGNINVEYKTFVKNSQSEYISNYEIGGDDNIPTGLYQIGNLQPLLRMRSSFVNNLQNIANAILRLDQNENVNLHLLCCQTFN